MHSALILFRQQPAGFPSWPTLSRLAWADDMVPTFDEHHAKPDVLGRSFGHRGPDSREVAGSRQGPETGP